MKLKLLDKLGDGAFADVWRARDELEREVAVKIIRSANLGVADALAHAKALARASHPNVVAVLTIEKITDPDSGDNVDCVVMELLQGMTLAKRLEGKVISLAEAQNIGIGIINGILHIHAQGMTHGDLHEENVMIVGETSKVIDILYLNSLALLSTEKRSSKLKRDLLSLRILLQQLIIQSELDSAQATEFNNLLDADADINDIKSAFVKILTPANAQNYSRALENAFTRLTEQDFVEGEDYAEALANETPPLLILPLLKRVVSEKAYDSKYRYYIKIIWSRLSEKHKAEFLQHMSVVIDEETPKGKWCSSLQMLSLLGKEGWSGLNTRVRIRLEGLIVKDVLAGHKDIHSIRKVSGGILGTYALKLWKGFKKPEVLADNLISLLRQNWYTQNYVGEYFLNIIPEISLTTNRRTEFVRAIKIAIVNDSRLVVNKIDDLPEDWIEEIRTD